MPCFFIYQIFLVCFIILWHPLLAMQPDSLFISRLNYDTRTLIYDQLINDSARSLIRLTQTNKKIKEEIFFLLKKPGRMISFIQNATKQIDHYDEYLISNRLDDCGLAQALTHPKVKNWLQKREVEQNFEDQLRWAAVCNTGKVKLLLGNVWLKIDAPDDRGRTALHYAAAAGMLASVKELILCGANVNARDKQGRTPYMDALLHCRPAAAKKLQEFGADPFVCDNEGNNVLDLAYAKKQKVLIRYLKRKGFKKTKSNNNSSCICQ